MARFGFAIDGSNEFSGLRAPQQVHIASARLIGGGVGDDILICRADDLGATYEGIARLRSIDLGDEVAVGWFTFDRLRRFDTPVTRVTRAAADRLYVMDDADFAHVVDRGNPRLLGFGEATQLPFEGPQDSLLASAPDTIASMRLPERCAFTGERLSAGATWTTIRHGHPRDAGNLIVFCPEAALAFTSGQFSARDDLSIVLDAGINRTLVRRLNTSRKLVVPETGPFRPSPDCLTWHRHFVARLA